jgi:Mg2+ and Co2+ transporter CorA
MDATMPKTNLIPETWNVPAVFRDRLGERPGRQRVMEFQNHLLFVLHEPPKAGDTTRKPRLFWRAPNGDWQTTMHGNGLHGFKTHLEELFQEVDHCDKLEDEASTARQYFEVLEQVSPLKRCVEHVHQVLQEARRLQPSDRDIINLRDQAYDISRTAELLYSATKNGMEMAQTRRAEEQALASMDMAAAAHRLNWLVAFFLPLATLTGVFGMQLATGIETISPPWPMVSVCAIGILLGAVFSSMAMKRNQK